VQGGGGEGYSWEWTVRCGRASPVARPHRVGPEGISTRTGLHVGDGILEAGVQERPLRVSGALRSRQAPPPLGAMVAVSGCGTFQRENGGGTGEEEGGGDRGARGCGWYYVCSVATGIHGTPAASDALPLMTRGRGRGRGVGGPGPAGLLGPVGAMGPGGLPGAGPPLLILLRVRVRVLGLVLAVAQVMHNPAQVVHRGCWGAKDGGHGARGGGNLSTPRSLIPTPSLAGGQVNKWEDGRAPPRIAYHQVRIPAHEYGELLQPRGGGEKRWGAKLNDTVAG